MHPRRYFEDQGKLSHIETKNFKSEHFVEAYIIKDGVCVAKDIIDVPIEEV